MTIHLYNTTSRKKEPFSPLLKGRVSMYHCGPTVYDYAHIGNLRSFVTWDILRRVFETNGYTVRQVMNVTDVDDKTIKRAREEGVFLSELTRRYEALFLNDIVALNVLTPHVLPKATEHIKEMVALVEKLLERGFAYKTDDGSVYFKVSAFGAYGNLAQLMDVGRPSIDDIRIARDEYGKEDIRDFALWKAWNKDDGEVFWKTRLGKGRPGWHIECSAMSMKYLGETFDIHTGGRDLIFPHHTNEIAQSEGGTGKPFVRYWLHNEFILVDGKKMAKSEGNIVTLADIKSRGIAPLAFRYWLLTAHYRTLVNFTWDALEGASNALRGLYERFDGLREYGSEDAEYTRRFKEYVADDLDTPRAIAVLWDMLKDAAVSTEDKRASLIIMDKVLGLGLSDRREDVIPDDVLSLVEEREEARRDADWKRADALRKKIEERGFRIKDTSGHPRVFPKFS